MHRCVVGMDPSVTGFAMTAYYSDGRFFEEEYSSKATKTLSGRLERYRGLANKAVSFLKTHLAELLVIEGYSFGSKGRSIVTLGEFGGVLRDRILDYADVSVEVPPTMLKKFVVGRGNASKMEVVQKLALRFKREFKSDNLADSFGLAVLGATSIGYIKPRNAYERSCVSLVQKNMSLEDA